jgi:hypothetical protein
MEAALGENEMLKGQLAAAALLAVFPVAGLAADQVEYKNIGGQNYMITRKVVDKPMSKTEYKEVARDVYREEYVTDAHDITRIVHVPVTEYRWETHLAGRWNPFSQPYYVQRLVPYTRMETRTEIVKVPVTRRNLVPETQIVKVPVTERWIAREEIEHKVAIDPPADRDVSSIASRPTIGGQQKLEGENPPRNGIIRK